MTSPANTVVIGSVDDIPVRNIWLLLLYASQLYRELPESRRVALEDAPDDIPELVAEILANAVERRLRRNLSHGHRRRNDELNRVRGRIDVFRTERRQLLQRARIACSFDELTVDTPRNRYVKSALTHISGIVKKPDLSRRCRNLALRLEMAGVSTEPDSRRVNRTSSLDTAGWVDAHEQQMLAAAKLALQLAIPTEASGSSLLPLVNRRETQGWRLYENAVAGFYDAVMAPHGWRVRHGSHIDWPMQDSTPGLDALMPHMITDIVLERQEPGGTAGQRIIIDTKFTSMVTRGQFGNQSLKSDNIYQLYAYLRSQERGGDPLSPHSTGVLLYPSLGTDYDEATTIQGHRMRFSTVDLAADTRTIREQLLRIVPGALPDATS